MRNHLKNCMPRKDTLVKDGAEDLIQMVAIYDAVMTGNANAEKRNKKINIDFQSTKRST